MYVTDCSCVCNSYGLAFTIYSSTGDHLKVAKQTSWLPGIVTYVFLHQGNLLFDETRKDAVQFKLCQEDETYYTRYLAGCPACLGINIFADFARILYSHPSTKLAKLMIQPPAQHEPKLTLIMV